MLLVVLTKPDGPTVKQEYRKGQNLNKFSLHDKQRVIDFLDNEYKTCYKHDTLLSILMCQSQQHKTLGKIRIRSKQLLRVTQRYFGASETASPGITQEISQGNKLLLLTEHSVMV